jgi:hypothetical protein
MIPCCSYGDIGSTRRTKRLIWMWLLAMGQRGERTQRNEVETSIPVAAVREGVERRVLHRRLAAASVSVVLIACWAGSCDVGVWLGRSLQHEMQITGLGTPGLIMKDTACLDFPRARVTQAHNIKIGGEHLKNARSELDRLWPDYKAVHAHLRGLKEAEEAYFREMGVCALRAAGKTEKATLERAQAIDSAKRN